MDLQPAWAENAARATGALAQGPARPQSAGDSAHDARAQIGRFHAGDLPPLWAENGYAQARQALQRLRAAQDEGLAPADYAVATPLPRPGMASPEERDRFETELTATVLRFLNDLHGGRSSPQFITSGITFKERPFDPAQRLRNALHQRRLDEEIAAAAPDSSLYARVKGMLAQYRQLEPQLRQLPPLPPLPAGPGLAAGARYAGAATLQARLVLLGDMPPDTPAAADGSYDDQLAAAVARFQQRHGLLDDGVLGKKTMAALGVPLAQRIRQLELTLERLRWMPPLPPGPVIVVNVPSFRLWALDTRAPGAEPLLDMRVIVGTAARTPTPLFLGALRYLEFNPAWNVPHSIATAEIVPRLTKEPDYLLQQDMELVTADGPVVASGAQAVALLRAGTARVRQRPGPRNVLGAVKFAMPNPMNIYLHSTSAKGLFNHARRDLSHGCIRVEEPALLAEFVLRGEAGWDRASVRDALQPGPTMTVHLGAPIPVILFYATALVERNGRAIFLDDIYGHDRKLHLALDQAGSGRDSD